MWLWFLTCSIVRVSASHPGASQNLILGQLSAGAHCLELLLLLSV
jgi:hypothetical protein